MTSMTTPIRRAGAPRLHPLYTVGLLGLLAAAVGAVCLARYVPPARWASLLSGASHDDLHLLMAQYVYLPRSVVSLLAGAMLGLAGVAPAYDRLRKPRQHEFTQRRDLNNPRARPTILANTSRSRPQGAAPWRTSVDAIGC